MSAMKRIYTDHTSNNICIHANHIREYQSQLWNNFSSLRTLQRSLIQTATLCKESPWRIFIPKIFNFRSRHRRENQSTARVPECINQSAANQSNDPLVPPGTLTRSRLIAYTWTKFVEKSSPGTEVIGMEWIDERAVDLASQSWNPIIYDPTTTSEWTHPTSLYHKHV